MGAQNDLFIIAPIDMLNDTSGHMVYYHNGSVWSHYCMIPDSVVYGGNEGMVVDDSNTIYVVFNNCVSGTFPNTVSAINVYKVHQNSFQILGNSLDSGLYNQWSGLVKITVDNYGIPHVIYAAQNGILYIKKYNGSSWVDLNLGAKSFKYMSEFAIDLDFNASNNPVVAYSDSIKTIVKEYVNGQWQNLSFPTNLIGSPIWVDIEYQNNKLYVFSHKKIMVYNQTWSVLTDTIKTLMSYSPCARMNFRLDANAVPYLFQGPFESCGSSPGVIYTYDSLYLGENEIKSATKNVEIYPNPATDRVRIRPNEQTAIACVKFYDLSGRLIMNTKLNEQKELDVSEVPSGLYFISVEVSGKTLTEKLLIRH